MAITVPTVSGYSGFWQTIGDAQPYAVLARTSQGWRSKLEWELARVFNRNQMREIREVMYTLLGAAAGSAALSTYKRVGTPDSVNQAVPVPDTTFAMGGQVAIETVTVVDRVTTAADLAYLQSILDGTMSPGHPNAITYAVDTSGNGSNSRTSDILQ